MKLYSRIIAVSVVISGCSSLNPSDFGQLAIQVTDPHLAAENKFRATVTFDNRLGREVNILNLGCSDKGHFIPNFTLERSVNSKWISFASPGCVAIAVGPTALPDGTQFTTTVAMLTDSIPAGTYRMKFDIREADVTKTLEQKYLMSNSFVITP